MKPEKQPEQMIIDQINLLKSEESKLKKFVNFNKDAESTVEVHLKEIEKKKKRLYHLCDIMGINHLLNESQAEAEPVRNSGITQPNGRFGSTLINWHVD